MAYYAVKTGLTPGIYHTWEECKVQVHGYSGAVYKSFKTRQEAEAFLGYAESEKETGTKKPVSDQEWPFPALTDKQAIAYVDGSYHAQTQEYSYGVVFFYRQEERHFSKMEQDIELATMRNVAGEIRGAQYAMAYAIEQGVEELTIYHDYEGIAKWCTGEWKTNKEGTRAYKAYYDSVKEKITIHFIKVKGHSHDTYNDLADRLAKEALGI